MIRFSGVSAPCRCHRKKSGRDRSRQTTGEASRGKENDRRWHARHPEALSTASHPEPPSVHKSEKRLNLSLGNNMLSMYAMTSTVRANNEFSANINFKLTTPGARKAVTLSYEDKSVYERREMQTESILSLIITDSSTFTWCLTFQKSFLTKVARPEGTPVQRALLLV